MNFDCNQNLILENNGINNTNSEILNYDAKKAKVDIAIDTANKKNREWTLKAAASEVEGLKKSGVTVSVLEPAAFEEVKKRSAAAYEALMPAGSVEAFKALAEATRQ